MRLNASEKEEKKDQKQVKIGDPKVVQVEKTAESNTPGLAS
jgi:hypothetical protein